MNDCGLYGGALFGFFLFARTEFGGRKFLRFGVLSVDSVSTGMVQPKQSPYRFAVI